MVLGLTEEVINVSNLFTGTGCRENPSPRSLHDVGPLQPSSPPPPPPYVPSAIAPPSYGILSFSVLFFTDHSGTATTSPRLGGCHRNEPHHLTIGSLNIASSLLDNTQSMFSYCFHHVPFSLLLKINKTSIAPPRQLPLIRHQCQCTIVVVFPPLVTVLHTTSPTFLPLYSLIILII